MAKNTAENNARHQREFGERMKEQGLVKRCFWVKQEKLEEIREYIKIVNDKT
jgi:hypothetical protein